MAATLVSTAAPHASGHTLSRTYAIEVGIRAYDPCLSCATQALGQMPLIVSIVDAAGHVINERVR